MRRLARILESAGIDVVRLWTSLRGLPSFFSNLYAYRAAQRTSFPAKLRHLYPVLNEAKLQAGNAAGHYFFQDLWAAKKISARRPPTHLDVGSRIDGFVAHVLTFMPVSVVDIRPLNSNVEGLSFVQADATHLAGIPDGSITSLSSLHAIEHFGLGRYGDAINPDAPFEALRSLSRVLAPGGRLYLSLPVGVERLEFNAHRVFSPNTILTSLSDLTLESFSMVSDTNDFIEDATLDSAASAHFACGLFEFSKPTD